MNRSRKRSPAGGFTIAEMLVVLGVLSLAAAVVVPMTGRTDDIQIRSAADQITAALMYVQTCAIAQGQQYQLVFDSANESFEVQNAAGSVIVDPISKDRPYRVSFPQRAEVRRVVIESVSFDGQEVIWFDRLGSPNSGTLAGGWLPLASGQIVIRAGIESVTIEVEPVTGWVKIPTGG